MLLSEPAPGLLTPLASALVPPAQVTVSGQSAEGMGPSKKVAKRNAAEKMLDLLGYKVPQPQPPKPALKTDEKVRRRRRRQLDGVLERL